MTDNNQLLLLSELLRLQSKFGRDAFARLARSLDDPRFLESLRQISASMTRDIPYKGRLARERSRKLTLAERMMKIIDELPTDDVERRGLLIEFSRIASDRSLMRTGHNWLRLASDFDIETDSKTGRADVVIAIMQKLAVMKLEPLREIVARLMRGAENPGGGLQDWTNLILKNRGKDQ